MPQRPDARAARDHQGIDLVRPNAGDRGGIDHHPDVGRHQSARGREVGQRVARARAVRSPAIPRTPAPDRRYRAGSRRETRRSRRALPRLFARAPAAGVWQISRAYCPLSQFKARLYSSQDSWGDGHVARAAPPIRNHQIALARLRGLQFSGCLACQPRRTAALDGCDEQHHRRQLAGDGAALDGGLLPVRQEIQPHSGLRRIRTGGVFGLPQAADRRPARRSIAAAPRCFRPIRAAACTGFSPRRS